MDGDRDTERSEGEGMVIHEEYIPGGVTLEVYRFLYKVLGKFKEDKRMEDLSHAASHVLGMMDINERRKLEKDNLREQTRNVVSVEEWEELEDEECYRALEYDAQDAGLGG